MCSEKKNLDRASVKADKMGSKRKCLSCVRVWHVFFFGVFFGGGGGVAGKSVTCCQAEKFDHTPAPEACEDVSVCASACVCVCGYL